MTMGDARCSVCETGFQPRFRYQVRDEGARVTYFCSQRCQQEAAKVDQECHCSVCEKSFQVEYPFQVIAKDGVTRYFCSTDCRVEQGRADKVTESSTGMVAPKVNRRIAVFNHKGGTGKTTTSVNLAAGIAETGKRVLLVDADGQGNVGASLGIVPAKNLYHVLVHGTQARDVVVPVRKNLDVICSNETLASAELYLANRPDRARVMRTRLGEVTHDYDVIVIDCAPALSLMNQNALFFADSVLVPVACDYLSLVGIKQVMRTIRHVKDMLGHEVEISGVLPTFYDIRNNISREALKAMRGHFGERCLSPIRVNTKLREAPAHRQTIFEYAPHSHGAADYMRMVSEIRSRGVGDENQRSDGTTVGRGRGDAGSEELVLSSGGAAARVASA